ncbi:ABC transporter permease [Nakamurella leprariae]|uniref:Transport permease protein n=1 Tax=Nakamurella leprariae TaxID=2803911 RepID=A0A938YCT4_9ACTN|nr:ABC transporter permease [Nakamurella leprariae]MBM9468287.1 ABC transporter permease [Nakamurella leprariae]
MSVIVDRDTAGPAPAAAGPPAARRAPRVGPVRSGWVFTRRSVLHSRRDVESLLMALMLPVTLMLLFTYVFGGAFDFTDATGPVPADLSAREVYATFVTPGIILLCAGFGAAGTAVAVADDMRTGIVDRFRSMPIHSVGVLTGAVVASLVRNLVATALVLGVGLLVGFRPDAGPGLWLAAIGLVSLFIVAITWLYAAIGLAAAGPQAASGYGFVLLFLPYLSSAFVPTETMPAGLRWFADHQPITPLVDTLRSLLIGLPAPTGSAWLAVGWCLVIMVGAMVWARWMFPRRAVRR